MFLNQMQTIGGWGVRSSMFVEPSSNWAFQWVDSILHGFSTQNGFFQASWGACFVGLQDLGSQSSTGCFKLQHSVSFCAVNSGKERID